MAPKPTPPPTVAAAPGAVPQPPPEFGIDFDEIAKVSSVWSGSAETIGELNFSTAADVVGEGSDTFSAARTCGDPASQAVKSISARIDAMASLVATFANNTNTTDAKSADALNKLVPR